jgi:uncharacterized protein
MSIDTEHPTQSNPRPRPRPGRMAAGHAILVVALALGVGLLLNASDILATAERQEAGWQRSVGVALMKPIATVSDVLFLDAPRAAIDSALGRTESEPEAPPTTVTTLPAPVATTTTLPGRREVNAAEPLRVFVGGDSMVGQFGPMLEQRAERSGVVEAEVIYEFESGITRPDFIDWPALLREVREEQDPEVMVLFFGGNDAQDIRVDGTWVPFGTDEWIAEYSARVGGLMAELEADGREVYWMGMPIVSSDTFRERVVILNQVYETQAAEHERVHYVESWSTFTGPDGEYSEYLPNDEGVVLDMRLNDGIHLTTDGGIRLAEVVYNVIAEDWALPSE